MEIFKKVENRNGLMLLFVRASFDEEEMALLKRFDLLGYRVKTREGAFVGRDVLPINIKGAYRTQLAKIKNRWSTALVRTTGFVFVDTFLLFIASVLKFITGLFKLFFGTRKRLSTAIKGITVRSERVEEIKEAEFFIFVSLAAIARALVYLKGVGKDFRFNETQLLIEMEGLDFAGAGSHIEEDFEQIGALAGQLAKVG